jgi:hypothetical protein
LDLSKNRISLNLDDEFIDLIKNSSLIELDLSQNLENGPNGTPYQDPNFIRFKEKTKTLSNIKLLL